jgi:large subunit ribosomal protein L17
MRHKKSGRKLNRNASHRRALSRNLVTSLFKQFGEENREFILTTRAKAKEYSAVAEKYITIAKKGNKALEDAAKVAGVPADEIRNGWRCSIAQNRDRKRVAKANKRGKPVEAKAFSDDDVSSANRFNGMDDDKRQEVSKLLSKSLHYRRLAASRLKPEIIHVENDDGDMVPLDIVKKLFEVIAPVYADRNGGYTRVLKTGIRRLGDGTYKAMLGFTPYPKQEAEAAA